MTPDDIGKIISESANSAFPPNTDGAAVQRAEASILAGLRPVRPLAPAWMWTLIVFSIFIVSAAISAAALGMAGFGALSALQRSLIFGALLGSGLLAALACVREMRPAAGTRINAVAWTLAVLGFPVLFSLVFRGYDSLNLVKEGVPCLEAGLWIALPTSVVIAWILRRGFVLQWSAAGLAAGALSGLAGLGMLELHCANLKAIHVILWHVAVVLISGLLGFVFGRIADGLRKSKTRDA